MNTAQRPLGGFEERLLGELNEIVAANAANAAGSAGQAAGKPAPERRISVPRRRPVGWRPVTPSAGRVRHAVLAGVLSAALATGLLASATVTIGGRTAAPGDTADAATFLRHAATAALAQPLSEGPVTGPNRVLWQKEIYVSGAIQAPGTSVGATRGCNVVAWFEGATGLFSVAFGDIPDRFCATESLPPSEYAYWRLELKFSRNDRNAWSPYPDPRSLPVSPDALLAKLRVEAQRHENYWGIVEYSGPIRPPHGAAPENVTVLGLTERLLQAPISARLRAALFEVMAKIPGVALQRGARDAIGRPAVAITINGLPRGAWWDVLLLDPRTYRVLGTRVIKVGSNRVQYSMALMQSGVYSPRS